MSAPSPVLLDVLSVLDEPPDGARQCDRGESSAKRCPRVATWRTVQVDLFGCDEHVNEARGFLPALTWVRIGGAS